jgi:hypothetical protein
LPLTLALPETLDNAYLGRVAAAWTDAVTALLHSRHLVKRVTWITRVVRRVADIELVVTDELRAQFPDLESVDALAFGAQSLQWPKLSADQTYVCVSVDARRTPIVKGFGVDPERGAVIALLAELEAVAKGLKHFGFVASAPLSPSEIVQLVHVASDPSLDVEQSLDRERLLAERVGVVPMLDVAPEIDGSAWHFARINESYHRGYWVSEWPLAGTDQFSVNHPLRALRPDVSGIQTVSGAFSRGGVSAAPLAHLRAGFDASLSTAEIVQASIVVLTAPSADHLGVQSDQLEYAGLKGGTEYRPLHGRHEAATLAALPLGRFLN